MNRKGFTLVEFVVVIMILAILISLSITVFAPQKVKYDNYASSLTNLLFRAKNAAIFNLYNTVVIYNNGRFTVFIDMNKNNVQDQNENTLATFPNGLDYLINSGSSLQDVRVFGQGQWNTITNNNVVIVFDRLGFATFPGINNVQTIQIYLNNQQVRNRYGYQYVISVSSGGDIRLLRRR